MRGRIDRGIGTIRQVTRRTENRKRATRIRDANGCGWLPTPLASPQVVIDHMRILHGVGYWMHFFVLCFLLHSPVVFRYLFSTFCFLLLHISRGRLNFVQPSLPLCRHGTRCTLLSDDYLCGVLFFQHVSAHICLFRVWLLTNAKSALFVQKKSYHR